MRKLLTIKSKGDTFAIAMYRRLRRLAFPEMDWNAKNPDRRRAISAKWNREHPEFGKNWCASHRDRRREIARNWVRHNKASVNQNTRKYKARKGGLILTDADRRGVMNIYSRCQELRRWFDVVV